MGVITAPKGVSQTYLVVVVELHNMNTM